MTYEDGYLEGTHDAIEHLGDELGWDHTATCAARIAGPWRRVVCDCHQWVLDDMIARFNYPPLAHEGDHSEARALLAPTPNPETVTSGLLNRFSGTQGAGSAPVDPEPLEGPQNGTEETA